MHRLSWFPNLDVALLSLRGPCKGGLRQEGIFGRFRYHNLSFVKENTGWGAQGPVRARGPLCTGSSARAGLGQDPEGLLQILSSQEPPHFLSIGRYVRGRAPYRRARSLAQEPRRRSAPPTPQGPGSAPAWPRAQRAALSRGAAGVRAPTTVSSGAECRPPLPGR